MNLADFDDPILRERNGRKAVYMDRDLVKNFLGFCKDHKKDPHSVAEYLLKLGIRATQNDNICIDIDSL